MQWMIKQWPYAALFAGLLLLALTPVLYDLMGLPLTLIYLQIPIYMVHQFEEHDRDRFRLFANKTVGGGLEVFTPLAIFVINSVGVWGVDIVALYLARFVDIGWGLVAVYLPVLNGITHIVMAVGKRCYNPGLVTGVVLFLPVGIWSIVVISPLATELQQIVAIAGAVLVHAAIMIHVRLRFKKLKA